MKKVSFFILFLIQFSCNTLPHLENFNRDEWVSDAGGCNNIRKSEVESLMTQKQQIMGLSENQITSLLGKPDFTELYLRTQKFMVYYISPGPSCQEQPAQDRPDRLSIRISALGVSNEVTYYKE